MSPFHPKCPALPLREEAARGPSRGRATKCAAPGHAARDARDRNAGADRTAEKHAVDVPWPRARAPWAPDVTAPAAPSGWKFWRASRSTAAPPIPPAVAPVRRSDATPSVSASLPAWRRDPRLCAGGRSCRDRWLRECPRGGLFGVRTKREHNGRAKFVNRGSSLWHGRACDLEASARKRQCARRWLRHFPNGVQRYRGNERVCASGATFKCSSP